MARILSFFCLFAGLAGAQTEKLVISAPKNIPECPAKYITDGLLASDGSIWVVSEGGGIHKLFPGNSYGDPWFNANYYANFPKAENFYAIAEDKQGRIWVGSDNQGVSVFNGVSWQTYSRESALLGERVFDIAVSPMTGEVAIATSAGVTIYHPEKQTWSDFTRAEGLVEDQVQSLSFSPDGTLWLAYACGGVSRGTPKNNYTSWETTQAPWFWDRKQRVRQPFQAKGTGLPSNLCNDISVSTDGTVWLATNSGLARKGDNEKWKFLRGRDYDEKNRGLFGAGNKSSAKPVPAKDLLPEDYVTCLAVCPDGVWVGTRRNGAALVGAGRMNIDKFAAGTEKLPLKNKWITTLIPLPDGSVCAGTYGGGLALINKGKGSWTEQDTLNDGKNADHPSLPSIPSDEELAENVEKVNKWNNRSAESPVLYWKDDWSTKGNWCGRYGANYGVLCAANAPYCDEVYNFFDWDYKVEGIMGANRQKGDSLRHWVHWVNAPHNDNVLYCPTDATRCEAEWDDHGEEYSRAFDGPDVWSVVKVPEGKQIVSLYFYNPNGKEGGNGHRDYLIEVRKHQSSIPESHLLAIRQKGERMPNWFDGSREEEMGKAISSPVLSRARVKDFAGSGVYKTFIVEGPGLYYFRVCRNYSLNSILNGVFVDRADTAHPKNNWANQGHWNFCDVYPKKPALVSSAKDYVKNLLNYRDLCNFNSRAGISSYEKASVYLYRKAKAENDEGLSNVLRWNLNEWSSDDRLAFNDLMRRSWDHKQEKLPPFRSAKFMPNAPNVIPFSVAEVQSMQRLKIDWKQYLPSYPGTPDYSVEQMRSKLADEIKQFKKKMSEQLVKAKKK